MKIQEALSGRRIKVSKLGSLLSGEVEQWVSEVQDIARNRHPWLEKYVMTAHLEESSVPSDAVGFIQLTPKTMPSYIKGPEEMPVITIPVVIKEKELAPLDLMAFEGTFHPLTENRVNRIMRMRSAFGKADSRPISVPLTEFGDAGTDEFNTMRDRGKGVRVRSLASIKLSSDTTSWREKFSSITPDNIEGMIFDELKAVEKIAGLEVRVQPDGIKTRTLYEINNTGAPFSEWEKVSAADLNKLVGPTAFNRVISDGQGFFLNDASRRFKDDQDATRELLEKQSEHHEPTEIKDLDGSKVYTWLCDDCGWVSGRPVFTIRLEDGELKKCDGKHQYLDKEGVLRSASSAIPVQEAEGEALKDYKKAKAFEQCFGLDDKTELYLWEDETGDLVHIHPYPGSTFIDKDGRTFFKQGDYLVSPKSSLEQAWVDKSKASPILYLPKGAKKITETVEKSPTEHDKHLVKVVNEPGKKHKGDISLSSDGEKVNVKTSLAHHVDIATSSLYPEDAVSTLVMLGASEEGAKAAVETAILTKKAEFRIKNPVITAKIASTGVKKVAADLIDRYTRAQKSFKLVKTSLSRKLPQIITENLERELPFVKQSETAVECLDIASGMKFLNETTLLKFIEFIPDLEKSLSKLSTLLLSSRIGLEEIDENSVKNAVDALDKIISGLRRIEYQLLI